MKIRQNFGKICEILSESSKKNQQFLTNILRLENGDPSPESYATGFEQQQQNARSCSGTFFLVAFFSAATRHAGVLSSSRLLRASSGHLFQMLSWPGSFLSMFFPGFWGFDSKTVQRSALCRSRRELSNEYLLANLASIQPRTSPVKFAKAPSNSRI